LMVLCRFLCFGKSDIVILLFFILGAEYSAPTDLSITYF
jgi:hypothetical protein